MVCKALALSPRGMCEAGSCGPSTSLRRWATTVSVAPRLHDRVPGLDGPGGDVAGRLRAGVRHGRRRPPRPTVADSWRLWRIIAFVLGKRVRGGGGMCSTNPLATALLMTTPATVFYFGQVWLDFERTWSGLDRTRACFAEALVDFGQS